MAATASIIIEVDDKGATQAFQRINAEAGKLGPTLQPVARISEQTFNNIEGGALKARESAALLGEEFGVHVPRALRGVLAESAGIGPALSAAFSGLAVIGFIEIIQRAGEAVVGLVEHFTHWAENTKKINDSVHEMNVTLLENIDKVKKLDEQYRLLGLTGIPQFAEKQKIASEHLIEAKKAVTDLEAELAKLRKQAQEAETIVLPGFGKVGSTERTATHPTEAAQAAQAQIGDFEKKINEANGVVGVLTDELRNAGKATEDEIGKKGVEALKKYRAEAESALKAIQAIGSAATHSGDTPEQAITTQLQKQKDELLEILKLHQKEPIIVDEVQRAILAIEKEARDKLLKLRTEGADKALQIIFDEHEKEIRDAAELARQKRRIQSETEVEERNAAIAMAPPWERANARIIEDYRQRFEKIKDMYRTGEIDADQAARRAAAAWNTAFAQLRDELANKMETLFDDITSGNIGKAFLTMFKHMVFQMVATWILGMQGMRAASQGVMGGSGQGSILGSIFGGIFGGGASGRSGPGNLPGVITNFGGNGDFGGETGSPFGGGSSGDFGGETNGGLLSGLGLSAGGGASGLGAILPSGAGPAGTGAMSGLLGKLFGRDIFGLQGSGQLLGMGGIALLASNFMKGGIGHALGGALGGAMLGFEVFGPLGALIGGIAGFFSGLFQHSTRKARLAIEAQVKQQAQTIETAYDLYQVDWTGATSQLEQVRTQGVDALRQAGVKDISRSRVGHVDQWVDKAEKDINALQAERIRRGAIDFGPAQFHSGGVVTAQHAVLSPGIPGAVAYHYGGEVFANLQVGEGVLTRTGLRAAGGQEGLDRLNSGGGSDAHVHLTVNALDAKSFQEWLRAGGGREIKRWIALAISEGAW